MDQAKFPKTLAYSLNTKTKTASCAAPSVRECQNCKQQFLIEPDDFAFYEKIQVPPPTFCPQCRFLRRMSHRNERSLYSRKCGLCGKSVVTNYSEAAAAVVYCSNCWWGDGWDAFEYGSDYDFSKPFFVQYAELVRRLPRLQLWTFSNVNSDYANYSAYCKNIYLSYSVLYSEDIMYSSHTDKSASCMDCYKVTDSQFCYSLINSQRCNKVTYSVNSKDCINGSFLYNCVNCEDCFMCVNLRNKRNCLRNTQLTRDEYAAAISKICTGSYAELSKLKTEFEGLVRGSIHRFANLIQVSNVTGDNVVGSRNALHTFDSENAENVKYCWRLKNYKDAYDISGALDSELCYEVCVGGDHNYNCKFYIHSSGMRNASYVEFCPDSSDVFGCVGLKKKSFCILNKQYSKSDYTALVPKIIEHMNHLPYIDNNGRVYCYGEFFPSAISPFGYNESLAQEHYPLNKEQSLNLGFKWFESDIKHHESTLNASELPDEAREAEDSFSQQVIACAHRVACTHQCTGVFRILERELEFYRSMNLALPRLCPNCRHHERLRFRNPLKLWRRRCMCAKARHFHENNLCPNEFETSYAPERPELVLCELCYQSEIL